MVTAILSPTVVRGLVRSPLLRRLAGPPPRNDRGERLDGQLHVMLFAKDRLGLPRTDELGAEIARVRMREDAPLVDVPGPRMHRVEDRWIEGPGGSLRLRVYTPRVRSGAGPALVYLHGGGFVVGDPDTHDGICRHLAARADVTVVSVDYRLAPEHPFPAPLEDCHAAFRWTHAHATELSIDPARIAIGGDSAGGNLAATTSIALRDGGGPRPALQLLIYPVTDLTRSMDSHRTFARGYFLERETMDWFVASYLTDPSQETDPRGSPIVVAELGGLPPAHVSVAGFDPLRDEGEAYAMQLMAAGVPTTLRCYGSLIHGFASMGGAIDAARFALDDHAAILREHLHDRAGG